MSKYKKVKIMIGEAFFNEYPIKNRDNQFIEYQDDTCINTIDIKDNGILFTRENSEFLLIMDSSKETAFYKLKELNYELDIKINYFDKLIENEQMIISYQLETNDKEIRLILGGE